MLLCKECAYCHISSGSGYGYCLAPLPYWVSVDRFAVVVVGMTEDDIKRTCYAFKERVKDAEDVKEKGGSGDA